MKRFFIYKIATPAFGVKHELLLVVLPGSEKSYPNY